MESKAPVIIRQEFGWVDRYVPNTLHTYPNVSKQPRGTVSDDTQLSFAVMDSLKRSKGYDLQDMRKAHIEAYDGKWGPRVGWGGSTKNACLRMKAGEHPSMEVNGGGNGPVIKISPLAIYAVYQTAATQIGRFTNSFNASLLKKCREISLLTHGLATCSVAAYCQARMVIRAMQGEIPEHGHRTKTPNQHQLVKLFISDAKYAEEKIQQSIPEGVGGPGWSPELLLSKRLTEILTEENFEKETGIVSTLICTSASSYILNSYPLVAYIICKYLPYRNFQFATTQAVNAGADADSNASMVAAIVGAHLGLRSVPKAWIADIRNRAMLEKEIVSFVNALTKL